jgi:hypothetical protein
MEIDQVLDQGWKIARSVIEELAGLSLQRPAVGTGPLAKAFINLIV